MMRIALASALALTASCGSPMEAPETLVEVAVPASFSGPEVRSAGLGAGPWWRTFGAPNLDATLDAVMAGSLELEQAWQRLSQADAAASAAGAPRFPTIDLTGNVQRFEIDQRRGAGAQIPIRLGETYSIGPALSYELDLFGRIDAAADAARLAAEASEADVRATALTLSGRAAEAWLTAVENLALAELVRSQIRTGEQLLDITRTRFGNGGGSALDVLQQQRLLEATRAELPRFEGAAERSQYQLAVLSGEAPTGHSRGTPRTLPALPALPALGAPAALFENRPDLRAAYLRVRSIDREVATAIAARYPRLTLSANYNFDGNELSAIFDRTISSIVAGLALPLIDGGSRRAEVRRQRARLDEAVTALEQSFLVACNEIEDALSLERRGLERITALEAQNSISVQEVEQARRRYAGGVDSYLQVLSAVQNSQALERQLLSERAAVLRARAQLLRSLGGDILTDTP